MNEDKKYVLALDQGTTSSRAMIFNHDGQIVASSQRAFEQHFPRPGWVEHDASEIWYSQSAVDAEGLAKATNTGVEIARSGITNTRGTQIIRYVATFQTVHSSLVWTARATAAD